jgi:malate/lactate dehydrogenase
VNPKVVQNIKRRISKIIKDNKFQVITEPVSPIHKYLSGLLKRKKIHDFTICITLDSLKSQRREVLLSELLDQNPQDISNDLEVLVFLQQHRATEIISLTFKVF